MYYKKYKYYTYVIMFVLSILGFNSVEAKCVGRFVNPDSDVISSFAHHGQLQWALSQPGKIVLVSGSPLELEQQYQKPFYFDQGGILTKKFAIDQVPARVSQQGKMLLVEIIPISNHENKESYS